MEAETIFFIMTMIVASISLVSAVGLALICARSMSHVINSVVPAIGAFVFATMSLCLDDVLQGLMAQLVAVTLLVVTSYFASSLPPFDRSARTRTKAERKRGRNR